MGNYKDTIREIMQIATPSLWNKAYYYHVYKRRCDINNPQTFSEKLLWLKSNTYQNNPLILSLCDKYEVRDYIYNAGLGEILNNLYFVTDDPNSIDYYSLPSSFVMKISLGCASNLICPDKDLLSEKELKRYIKGWSKGQYLYDLDSARIGGVKVRDLKKHIICEEFLSDGIHSVPPDFKVYCFNGKPTAILYISDRYVRGEKKACFMDCDWNYLGESNSHYKKISELPPRPQTLTKMVEAARVLSKPFPFVRVDFYEIKGKLVFGEMTFFPSGCIGMSEIDIDGVPMGDLLEVK